MSGICLGRAIGLAAAMILGLLSAPGGASAQGGKCPVPESFFANEPLLPKMAKALSGGREIRVVAIGGASTLGRAAANPALAWPMRLGAALTKRFPSARVKVTNLGLARQSAHDIVSRLEREVLPMKPDLVIWETGTMEAIRGTDVEGFREELETGLHLLQVSGIDTLLMDMQFSRRTNIMINFDPYLTVIREVADAVDVPLFRRHDIMRHWAENKMVNLLPAGREKRRLAAAHVYDCIGKAMADFVTRGVAAAPPAPVPGSGR